MSHLVILCGGGCKSELRNTTLGCFISWSGCYFSSNYPFFWLTRYIYTAHSIYRSNLCHQNFVRKHSDAVMVSALTQTDWNTPYNFQSQRHCSWVEKEGGLSRMLLYGRHWGDTKIRNVLHSIDVVSWFNYRKFPSSVRDPNLLSLFLSWLFLRCSGRRTRAIISKQSMPRLVSPSTSL